MCCMPPLCECAHACYQYKQACSTPLALCQGRGVPAKVAGVRKCLPTSLAYMSILALSSPPSRALSHSGIEIPFLPSYPTHPQAFPALRPPTRRAGTPPVDRPQTARTLLREASRGINSSVPPHPQPPHCLHAPTRKRRHQSKPVCLRRRRHWRLLRLATPLPLVASVDAPGLVVA